MTTPEDLLSRIETFLKGRPDISTSRFGKDAVGDPNFVKDLREGREPRRKTIQRAEEFLIRAEAAQAA
jgi:hypothetical protein